MIATVADSSLQFSDEGKEWRRPVEAKASTAKSRKLDEFAGANRADPKSAPARKAKASKAPGSNPVAKNASPRKAHTVGRSTALNSIVVRVSPAMLRMRMTH